MDEVVVEYADLLNTALQRGDITAAQYAALIRLHKAGREKHSKKAIDENK